MNNVGTENPPDVKSKEGFDVRMHMLYFASLSCKGSCSVFIAAHHGHQLSWSVLLDSPACKAVDRYPTLENGSADFLGRAKWRHRMVRHWVRFPRICCKICSSLASSYTTQHESGQSPGYILNLFCTSGSIRHSWQTLHVQACKHYAVNGTQQKRHCSCKHVCLRQHHL